MKSDKVAGTSTPSGRHLAAILTSKGFALEIKHRQPLPQATVNSLSN
jgi:hypothetical protein